MKALTLVAAACRARRVRGQPQYRGPLAREVKTFKVTGQAELVLDTFDGAIELHSWDSNEIEVEVEKRAMEQSLLDEIKIDAQQEGDKIIVKVTGPRATARRHDRRAHFTDGAPRVAVPRNANINATSGDGSISAEAIEGRSSCAPATAA
jgi:hypothetical protein